EVKSKMRDMKVKSDQVDEYQKQISQAKVLVLSSVEGVTVDQMTLLRKNLRKGGDEIKVVKNTMLRRALQNLKMDSLLPHTYGSTAVVMGYQDPVSPVKTLFEFIEKAKKFKFKAGYLGDKLLLVKDLEALSKLPGRKQLLSMVVGAMVGSLRNIVSVTQGPIRKLVYALDAIRQKKEKTEEKAA
ncbi:MAG: 50S ribosomal protein L10, partial [Terrimicrobiaceae bacterium]